MTTPTPTPPPQAELVGALHDRVHREVGKSRPAKANRAQARPPIRLPELPDVRDGEGRRICAVLLGDPGKREVCGRPHRSSGRCQRCYIREYQTVRRRADGVQPLRQVEDGVVVSSTLPSALLAQVRARQPGCSVADQIRRALEQWVASTPAP